MKVQLKKDFKFSMKDIEEIANVEMRDRKDTIMENIKNSNYDCITEKIEEIMIIQEMLDYIIEKIENNYTSIYFFIRAGLPSECQEPKNYDEAYDCVVNFLTESLGDWDYEIIKK